MQLGIEFVLSSLFVIIALLPLYLYRKRIFRFLYDKNDISLFVKNIQIYLSNNISKIQFDYSIVKKVENEHDSRIKQTLIIEDLVSQFANFPYSLGTQRPVNKGSLWATYEQESKPLNGKSPKDLIRRKEVSWRRDHEKCNRCGIKIRLMESHLMLVKSIEKGGTYHFENIAILCSDCYRLLNSKNPESTAKDLKLQETLMDKAIIQF